MLQYSLYQNIDINVVFDKKLIRQNHYTLSANEGITETQNVHKHFHSYIHCAIVCPSVCLYSTS